MVTTTSTKHVTRNCIPRSCQTTYLWHYCYCIILILINLQSKNFVILSLFRVLYSREPKSPFNSTKSAPVGPTKLFSTPASPLNSHIPPPSFLQVCIYHCLQYNSTHVYNLKELTKMLCDPFSNNVAWYCILKWRYLAPSARSITFPMCNVRGITRVYHVVRS